MENEKDTLLKPYHSRAYHKYFEGYVEKEVTDAQGKPQIIRVYAGDYYYPEQTRLERKREKQEMVLLTLLAVVLYMICGSQRITVNLQIGVALFEAGTFCAALLFLQPLYYLLTAADPYTIRIYRIVTEKAAGRARIIFVCFWGAAAMMIGYLVCFMVTGKSVEVMRTLLCVLGELTGGLCFFVIYRRASRQSYRREPSGEVSPEHGVRIRY